MFRRDERGAAGLDYALLLPVFLTLVIGLTDVGRLAWTQVSLDHAVQTAARCATLKGTSCGTDTAIQSYALAQVWSVDTSAVTVSVTHPSCGVQVSATNPFQFVVPWPATGSVSLQSTACYPVVS